jgi:hypothetical protein
MVLPYNESEEAENTKEKHHDDLERVPAEFWAVPGISLVQEE